MLSDGSSPIAQSVALRYWEQEVAVRSPARPIFFPRIDDNCDRIHSALTTVHCFDNGCVGKQPVASKEYCAEHWLKELQESMAGFTGCHDINEILLKMAFNTIQSTNQRCPCSIKERNILILFYHITYWGTNILHCQGCYS